MSLHTISVIEQLIEVEKILIAERRTFGTRNDALRAIAADLRGRLNRAPSVTFQVLQMRVKSVKDSKTPQGYDKSRLIGLAQEFTNRWPVVMRALEKYGAEFEGKPT